MMWKIIFVFMAFAARGESETQYKKSTQFRDYYKQTCNGIPHLMHTYDHDFSNERCGPKNDRQLVKMTDKMIAQILNEHNSLRAKFARGEVKGYPGKVKRMSKLHWDPELAYYAEVLALQCLFEHDGCHYTSNFPYSGQNLYKQEASTHTNPSDLISESINGWFMEKDNIPKQYRTSTLIFTEELMSLPKQVGHFTAMIHEYGVAIGCAIVYAKSGRDPRMPYAQYFYCNYGATNFIDQPIYRTANIVAEGCKTGQDPYYNGLCSDGEDFRDTLFLNSAKTKKFPEPPLNEGAVAKIYKESSKSTLPAAAAATYSKISCKTQEQLLASLQQQGLPKKIIDHLRQKMKRGPLKGDYNFKIKTGRGSQEYSLKF